MDKLFGALNVNKPVGMTSRQAVDCVKRLVRPVKVGHVGTLDPLASGVLIVCLGPATRLTEYAHRFAKTYRATFLLGCRSATDDLEGELQQVAGAPQPSIDEVQAALPDFLGDIQQRPPAFSAVKVKGQVAYKLARRGQQLDLPERTVTVDRLEVLRYEYPELELDVQCGSGTYIRSLGRDLAESLGTGAVMSALVRMAIGPFTLKDAISTDDLDTDKIHQALIPPQRLLQGLPTVELSLSEVEEVRNGRPIAPLAESPEIGEEIAALKHDLLVAILIKKSDGLLWPKRNFVT